MPDKTSVFIKTPNEEGYFVDADQFNSRKDDFFKQYNDPDIEVAEVSPYIHGETQVGKGDLVSIQVGDETPYTVDGEQFASRSADFLKNYPTAKIQRLHPINYWGDKLTENYNRREQLQQELQGLPQEVEGSELRNMDDGDIMTYATRQVSPQAKRRREIQRELEQLNVEREKNPAWQKYWKQQVDDLDEDLNRIDVRKQEAQSRIDEGDAQSLMDPEILNVARNLLQEARETAAAPSKYDDSLANAWKGIRDTGWDAVSFVSLAKSLGKIHLIDAVQAIQRNEGENANVMDLVQNHLDEMNYLSIPQRELMRAFVRKAEVEAGRADNMSRWYQAGQGFAQSLGFMADFALAGGLGEAAADKIVGKGISGAAKAAGETTLKKIGAESLYGAVKAAAMTPLMPSTYSNILDNITKFDDKGGVDLSGKAVLKAVGDAAIETVSETIGSEPLKLLGWGAAKVLPADWIGKTQFGAWAKALRHTPVFNAMKQAGWNGFVEEMFEEVSGNALRVWSGIDKDALKDFMDPDQLLITAASFAPMSILGGVPSTVQYSVASRKMKKAGVALQDILRATGIEAPSIDVSDDATPEALGAHLGEMYREAVARGADPAATFKAAQDYAAAASNYKVLEGIFDEQKGIDRARQTMELDAQLGIPNWNHEGADGQRYVRTLTGPDGQPMYVTGEDENGLILAVDQSGAPHYVNQEGIADGVYEDSGEVPLNEYLDNSVMQQRQAEEQQRMDQEQREASNQLAQLAYIGKPDLQIGTEEQPATGTILSFQGGEYIVQNNEDGTIHNYTPEQMGAMVGVNMTPKTDEQIEQEEADAVEFGEENRSKVNAALANDIIDLDGFRNDIPDGSVASRVIKMDDGTFRLAYLDPSGKEQMADVSYPDLAELAARADVVLSQQPAELSADVIEEPATEETEPELPAELSPEEETNLWNEDPAKWAAWNDRNRQDGGADSIAYIQAAAKAVEGAVNKAQKQYAKELDFGKRRQLADEVARQTQRLDQLNGILADYQRRAEAAQRAELARQKAAEAEKNAPRTPVELAAAYITDLAKKGGLRGKLNREDFARELGREPGDEEMKKFFSWWAKEGQGKTVYDLAEDMAKDYDTYGIIPMADNADQKDIEVARNAIIELFNSSSLPSEITNLIAQNREAEEEDQRAGEAEAQPAAEIDENGIPFVTASDGTTIFGTINQESGLPAAPIKLSEGKITNSETNEGYGLAHIESRHGDEIRRVGFGSVQEFVEFVAKNYDPNAIKIGKNSKKGAPTYLIQVKDKNNNTLFIELSSDGTYWNVNSGGVFRNTYGDNKESVQPASAQQDGESVPDNTLRPSTEADNEKGPNEDVSAASSDNKDSEISEETSTSRDNLSQGALDFNEEVEQARQDVDTNPSDAQNEAIARPSAVPYHPDNLRKAYESGDAAKIAESEKAMADYINSSTSITLLKGSERQAKNRRLTAAKGSPEYKTQDFVAKTAAKRMKELDKILPKVNGLTASKAYDAARKTYGDRWNASVDELRQAIVYYEMELTTAQQELAATGVSNDENTEDMYVLGLRGRVSMATTFLNGLNAELRAKTDELTEAQAKSLAFVSGKTEEQIREEQEQRRQQPLRDRIKEWEERTGQEIEVIGSFDEIKEQPVRTQVYGDRTVKGWFNPSNNKVVVYLPNTTDVSDIDKTYLHEIISHKGLRELLGQDGFNVLMDRVYSDVMTDADRQRYAEYNRHLRGGSMTEEQLRRADADEYVAHLAENMDADPSAWQKFVALFKEALMKLGLNIQLTDQDLSALLHASLARYEFMQRDAREQNRARMEAQQQRNEDAAAFVAGERTKAADTAAAEKNPQVPISETQEKYEDFGEKIGWAKKDLAKRGYSQKKGEGDARPAWRKKYEAANITELSESDKAMARRMGLRTDFTLVPKDILAKGPDYSKPFVGYYVQKSKSKYGRDRTRFITDETGKPIIFTSEDQYEATIPVFEAKDQGYRVRQDGNKFKIVRPASNGKMVEYAEFDSREDAVAYLASPEGCTDLLNRKRENYELPALEELTRNNMPDYRNGKNITPDDFQKMFKFRGGEFGNWNNAAERQQALNYAYDALMDLAMVLRVTPESLSLNGELSIAFGARGEGGAKAHYEPTKAVINLTKMKGAGSLAHEWAHALDNYFGLMDAKQTRNRDEDVKENQLFLSEGSSWKKGARQEVRDAFAAVMKAIKEKTVTRQIALDKAQKEYDDMIGYARRQLKNQYREQFARGLTRYQYNRKTKERDVVKIVPTEEQLAEYDRLAALLETDPTFKMDWDMKKAAYRGFGDVATQFYDLVKDVMPNRGGEKFGPLHNAFYYLDKALPLRERLEKAKAGETETVSIPTTILEDSRWFDRMRAGEYYAKDIEMFARAFENYVSGEMRGEGQSSDYLTYEKGPLYQEIWDHNPYPAGEERAAVKMAFDHLFDVLQEKVDAQTGRTMLFRKDGFAVKEGNVYFRKGRSLVGMHNISENKLAKAMKTGGLANPSAAVVDIARQNHEDYGEISLIMPSSLVDSETGRNIGTFLGDAWTPTYPGTQKIMSDAGWDKLFADVRTLPDEVRSKIRLDYDLYLEDNRMADSLKWWFLHDTGRNPEIVKHESGLPEATRDFILSLGDRGDEAIENDRETFDRVADLFRQMSSEEEIKKAETKLKPREGASEFVKRRIEGRNAEIDKYGIAPANIFQFWNQLHRQIRLEGSVNGYETFDRAARFIESENLQNEFQEWLDARDERYDAETKLFAGWTRDGEKKWLANTVENASRLMNGEPQQNSYGNGGLSATRANLVQRMRTLADIRRHKDLLVMPEEYDERYKELEDELFAAIQNLADRQKISDNQFSNIDYAEARLQEALPMRSPAAYLNAEYGYSIPVNGEYAESLKQLKKDLRAMPAKYFETKFGRPVMLDEFAAAVVPSDIKNETRKTLIDAGLALFEYDPKESGSRREATMKATEGDNILFRKAYHGSGASFDRFDHSHMGEGEGAQAHGWGTYVSFNEDTAKGYATRSGRSAGYGERMAIRESIRSISNQMEERSKANNRSAERHMQWVKDHPEASEQEKEDHRKLAESLWENDEPIFQALDREIRQRELLVNSMENAVTYKHADIHTPLEEMETIADAVFMINHLGKADRETFLDYYRYDMEHSPEGSNLRKVYDFVSSTTDEDWTSNRNFYTVEIPEDTGLNYMDEQADAKLTDVAEVWEALSQVAEDDVAVYLNLPEFHEFNHEHTGKSNEYLYQDLARILGSQKEASKLLERIGYAGIKYDGRIDGPCAVIFNDQDVKITDHIRFCRAFHGSPADFSEFEEGHYREGVGSFHRPGYYFASDEKSAKTYAYDRGNGAFLYEVELPNDDGSNYIHVFTSIPKSKRRELAEKIRQKFPDKDIDVEKKIVNKNILGEDLLGMFTNDELQQLGFVGIEGPMYIATMPQKQYVIFNPKDIKIKGKTNVSTGESIRFRRAEDRQEDESAYDFVNRSVHEFNQHYGRKKDDLVAHSAQSKNFGAYVPAIDKIVIFANEELTTYGQFERGAFHEEIHLAMQNLGTDVDDLFDRMAARLNPETVERNLQILRDEGYEDDEIHNEFVTRYLETAAAFGSADLLAPEIREITDDIFKHFKYEPENEVYRRGDSEGNGRDRGGNVSATPSGEGERQNLSDNEGEEGTGAVSRNDSGEVAPDGGRYSPSPLSHFQSTEGKRDAATKVAAACGIEIEFKPSAEMQENGKALAGRWENGKMYICPEHCRDTEDAIRTVLHEGVGHNGLRRLIGNENMRAFCMDVYRRLPESARKEIADAAVRKYGANIAHATEEYLARKAETIDYSDRQERSFWDTVRDALRRVLAKIGIDVPLSERDIRWLMWQSYNANKQSDILNLAKRQVVANRLGFTLRQEEYDQDGIDTARNREAVDAEISGASRAYNFAAQNVWKRMKESFVDQYTAINELVSAIEKESGRKAASFEDIRLALNQQGSKALAKMNDWIAKYNTPMWDEIKAVMKKAGCDLSAVERYVMLKHGLERNEVFAKRDARAVYQSIHDNAVKKIQESDHEQYVKDEEIAREDAKLDRHFRAIENGTDKYYQEYRERDYGGLTGLYSEFDDVEPRRKGETAEEFAAREMAARHPMYDNVADMEAAARTEVADFERKADTSELWKRINAATKETLRQQYEANIISRGQYTHVRDMFQYYVPLRGFSDKTAEDLYDYYNSDQRGVFTSPLQRAGGRTTKAESPFGFIAAAASSGIAQDMKNESKLALYYFISNRKGNDLVSVSEQWYEKIGEDEEGKAIFEPVYPPFNEDLSSEQSKRSFEDWEKAMREKARSGLAFKGRGKLDLSKMVVHINPESKKDHVISFKLGGKDMMMYINGNPRAAQAINNELNYNAENNVLTETLNQVLRTMAALNTQLNPEFWISNFQRDALFALMSVSTKEGGQYAKDFGRNVVAARKVVKMKKAFENGTLGDSHDEQLYREFVENGGVTGYTVVYDNEYWEKRLDEYAGKDKNLVAKAIDALKGISEFGEAIEQMTRFAAFKTSREAGKDIKQSVADAKELTVNFNRKGSGKAISLEEAKKLTWANGRALNKAEQLLVSFISNLSPYGRRFIMFFNASIQGLNAMVQLYKKNPARAAMWSGGYLAVGMMNAILHALVDDDDDYLDIPDWERRNNLLLGVHNAYLKWALPQEARVFYGLGDMIVNHAMGRTPNKNIIGELLSSLGEVAPIDFPSGIGAFAPSAATPIVDIVRNEDYKGARVYNEHKYYSEEERRNVPAYRDPLANTGGFYVSLSKVLNALSGGDEYQAGKINWNPNIIEHLVEGYTGGTGTSVEKLMQFFGDVAGGELVVRNTPFLRRVLSINDERYRNTHTTELFYYYQDEASSTRRQIKEASKVGDDKKLDKIYDSREYEEMLVFDSYNGLLKYYNDALKLTDDPDERKSLMREQDAIRKEMIQEISNIGK